jgi:multiple sugar transport system permease protein
VTATVIRPRHASVETRRGIRKLRPEQRLAFILVAPAGILMLAVTAYPISYAVWLSL